MTTVIALSPDNATDWDTFVRQHPHGSPFHLTGWKKAIDKTFGHQAFYFCTVADHQITGILPLFELRSLLFGNILSSLPFAAYGGILATDDHSFNVLLEQARKLAGERQIDYLELKFQHPQKSTLPETDIYYAFVKELFPDHDRNLAAIPRKQRRMVRIGHKEGLTAEVSDTFLDQFYEIFAINVRRLGTPVYPLQWFRNILEIYQDQAELLVIRNGDTIIAGVISLYFNHTVLPFYAASLVQYRHLAPNDFLYWQLMQRAVDRGCRFFDFGRSKQSTGHFRYKTHWGFSPQPLHYQYHLERATELPALNPLNPKYRLQIALWKKMPLILTKIIGPRLVQYIP